MATEVGNLVLKVDTSDVKAAEAAVERLGQESGKTTASTDKLTESTKRLSESARRFIERSRAATEAALKQRKEQEKQNEENKKTPKAANDSGAAFDLMGRKAGMASVQIEQLIGQIAMGQNPLRAIGVQAADLGFILGVPLYGAVIGVTAAIASMIPALTNSGKSVEDLIDSMRDFADIMSINAVTAVYELDKAFVDLAESSRELAVAKLQNGLSLALLDLGTASEVVSKAVADLKIDFGELEGAAYNVTGGMTALTSEAARLGIARDRIKPFQDALRDLENGAEGAAQKVAVMIAEFEATGQTTQKFRELAAALLEAIQVQDSAQSRAAALGNALQNLDDAINRSKTSAAGYAQTTEGMIAALEEEAYTAGMTAKQIALLAIVRQGEKEGLGPDQLAAIYARADALLDEADAAKKAADALKEANKTREREQKEADRFIERIAGAGDSKLQAIDRQEAARLEKIQEYRDKELITQQEYEDAKTAIELGAAQSRTQAIMAENDRMMQILVEQDRQRKDSAQNVTDSLIAFEDILLKGKSEKQKAGYRLAVNLANAEKREAAKKIITDSYSAAMGAYKALAGIPIVGPALGAAAAATILAAGVSYAAQSLSGRALGGQVRAGESYIVGERGPEILTMGTGGRITPNEAISSGGSQQISKTANVSFNISANDSRGFDELLSSRRGLIIGMINEAIEDQGREALV